MRNKISINEPDVIINQRIKTSEHPGVSFPDLTEKKSNLEIVQSFRQSTIERISIF